MHPCVWFFMRDELRGGDEGRKDLVILQRQPELAKTLGQFVTTQRGVVGNREHVLATRLQGLYRRGGARHGVVVVKERSVDIEQVGSVVVDRSARSHTDPDVRRARPGNAPELANWCCRPARR